MAACFPNVSCSACGECFGPGDHGFSHCRNHAGLPTVLRNMPEPDRTARLEAAAIKRGPEIAAEWGVRLPGAIA